MLKPIILFRCILVCFSYKLTIIHDNDVHSRFTEFNQYGGSCTPQDKKNHECFGGAARRKTVADKIRSENNNVVYVCGGDQFQGSLWYSVLKWQPIAMVMNEIGYDAMAFGNHEFDDGLAGLIPFVKALNAKVVSTNIDSSQTELDGLYKKILVLNIGGQKIGILGYTTPSTAELAKVGNLHFKQEIPSLREGVEVLEEKGINKIIAVGHSGISKDRQICQNVAGIDVVVGGHTNTFLYTGEPPSREKPEGDYPEVFTETGSPCLVVQDYAFGKYLGFLQVDFDSKGVVTKYNGNPILLNDSFAENAGIVAMLQPFERNLTHYSSTVVGHAASALDGTRKSCRLGECNLGNLLADAMVELYVNKTWERASSSGYWTEVSIGILNGGSIRDFEATPGQKLTMANLLEIWPFKNTIDVVRLTGKTLLEIFEHSVRDYSPADAQGRFLQVSGIHVTYDLNKPNGKRVSRLELLCAQCAVPKFEQVIPHQEYNVTTLLYIIQGGDGYSIIKNQMLDRWNAEDLDVEVLTNYFGHHSPLRPSIEGRIKFKTDPEVTGLAHANLPKMLLVMANVLVLKMAFG